MNSQNLWQYVQDLVHVGQKSQNWRREISQKNIYIKKVVFQYWGFKL